MVFPRAVFSRTVVTVACSLTIALACTARGDDVHDLQEGLPLEVEDTVPRPKPTPPARIRRRSG